MEINKDFAHLMVNMIKRQVNEEVTVFGHGGVVIASTIAGREGSVHAVSKRMMAGEMDYYGVTKEEAAKLENVRAGANVIIKYNNERVGVIGITGDPELVKPIATFAAQVIELRLARDESEMKAKSTALQLKNGLETLTALIEEMAASSQEQAGTSSVMAATALDSQKKAANTEEILALIKGIADMTKLLGLNAAIEAARAGEYGKGFNVVANEVRKLADNSAQSVKQVGLVIKDIQQANEQVAAYSQQLSQGSEQLSKALQEMVAEIEKLNSIANELTLLYS